jgi:LmbE family N-acetylglucosaminyl deacetylase
MRFFLFTVFLLSVFNVYTQPFVNKNQNSSEIKLGFERLSVLGNVLYIAAHPDDENTRFLAYCALERGYETSYLSLTRGDGGQNLIGNEQGIELGLIRTQELLAARSIDGAHQYFTRAYDFGFSKNAEETFKKWDKKTLLGDVVWMIRKLKPDVIVTRFSPEPGPTHGHHTASAMLAVEAFHAAADPKQFPEQLAMVEVHQAKRIFWNTSWFFFGTKDYDKTGLISLNVGGYNALLGKSYGEIAAESRSMHSSQGFGSARQRGDELEYFKFLDGESAVNDIFEGINTSWKRLGNYEEIEKFIQSMNSNYNPRNPQLSINDLVELHGMIKKIPSNAFTNRKLNEIENLIIQCAGIYSEVIFDKSFYRINEEISGKAEIIVRSDVNVQLKSVKAFGVGFDTETNLKKNELLSLPLKLNKDVVKTPNAPFWLYQNVKNDFFQLPDLSYVGPASNHEIPLDMLSASIKIVINGSFEMEIHRPIIFKKVLPESGEIYSSPVILPPVTIHPKTDLIFFRNAEKKRIGIALAGVKNTSGKIRILAPEGWIAEPVSQDFKLSESGTESFDFNLYPGANAKSGIVRFIAEIGNETYSSDFREIKYNHIPAQFYLPEAVSKVIHADLKIVKKSIGYISGAGDNIPQVLEAMGYHVKLLSDEEIVSGRLSDYQAIVIGVRAYNTRESLKNLQKHLMKYVNDGGNLVVQYNTSRETVTDELGPYPLKLGRDRVTVEEAPIKVLTPTHPLLNYPNKISEKDFEGWVQERGLYFVSEFDQSYEPIFEIADPGEKPSKGSLIFARFGKGTYSYTGLSFFRQLPAGVEGASRLFVNLIEAKP